MKVVAGVSAHAPGVAASLEPLFRPRGIAIAGASLDPTKPGHQVLRNLLEAGYPGPIAVIHPKAESILGTVAFPDLTKIPATVEMLILALPVATTPAMVESIRQRQKQRGDLRVVVALAGGFAESGTDEGRKYQEMLVTACRELGIRLVGPNCLGIIDNRNRIDTTFIAGVQRRAGGIALLSRSGAVGAWLALEWATMPVPAGVNKLISLGNTADLTMADVLEYLERDPHTRSIGLYVEAPPDKALAQAAGRAALRKPVVLLQVGRTESGAKAARCHTSVSPASAVRQSGSSTGLAGSPDGLIQTQRMDEFGAILSAFDRLPLPLGGRVGVLTNAAGPGVYTLDALADRGVSLANPSPAGQASMRSILPPFATVSQPVGYVDMTEGVGPRRVAQAVAVALRDPGVDAVLFLFVPSAFNTAEEMARELLSLLPGLKRNSLEKPLYLVLLAGQPVAKARKMLEEAGMVTFDSPDHAAAALSAMVGYSLWRQRPEES